jgi:hypothetical protein
MKNVLLFCLLGLAAPTARMQFNPLKTGRDIVKDPLKTGRDGIKEVEHATGNFVKQLVSAQRSTPRRVALITRRRVTQLPAD